MSLRSLSKEVLNVVLSKDVAIRCSNWEAETYNEEQVRNSTRSRIAVLYKQLKLLKYFEYYEFMCFTIL